MLMFRSVTFPLRVSLLRMATVACALSVLSACSTVRLISDYDEETDKQLTALKKASDTHFNSMLAELPISNKLARSPTNSYDAKKAFYAEFAEKLSLLEFRTQSMPKNSQTQDLLSKLRAAVLLSEKDLEVCVREGLPDEDENTKLSSMQALHCLKRNKPAGPVRDLLMPSQRSIDQLLGQALTLELKKKQGTETK